MDKISVIIPTYNNPDALDLCLKSCIEGQTQPNQIIVVCDGRDAHINSESILNKYKENISILPLMVNEGLPKATNLGVYNSKYEYILIVNDDNVFPKGWDEKLLNHYEYDIVLTPNQIEPRPSIFKQFIEEDLGETPNEFDLYKFNQYNILSQDDFYDESGSTLPIFMAKTDYLRVGGWDENYPTNGIVADWDFFLKCQLSGMEMRRTYSCNFYHFGSMTVKDKKRIETEQNAHKYAEYKWGTKIKHNPETNLKYL